MWCLWRINSQQIEVLSTENYFPSSKKKQQIEVLCFYFIYCFTFWNTQNFYFRFLRIIQWILLMHFVDNDDGDGGYKYVSKIHTHTHMDLSALSQIQWVVLGIYSVWCPDYPFNNPNSILLELPSLNKKKKKFTLLLFLISFFFF